MIGVPDENPRQTSFGLRPEDRYDGSLVQREEDGFDVGITHVEGRSKVVAVSHEMEADELLWTVVYWCYEFGVPGGELETIRVMSATTSTDTYRLGGLYRVAGLPLRDEDTV